MEENKKKDIEKPLTTDEIRLQAHKWTLAGDVGLLAHLEQFSQNLFSKSEETQKNINALLDSFEDTSTRIYNVTNQFLALQNSQFVENRIYDDESPVEEHKNEIKVSKEEQEKHLLAQYKEAVEIGVQLLDSHFEEVQLPLNSDSDEEEIAVENSGLVWKPKNPYTNKRFPLLIGSAEWWADDNVGLGEYEENVNPDSLSSQSESEMEEENAPEKRIRMSSSSSMESDKIISKRPKEQIGSGYDEIFTPKAKDMFSPQTNLFKPNGDDDDDNDSDAHYKPPNNYEVSESVKPLNLPLVVDNQRNDIDDSYYDKKGENSLFEGSGDNFDPVASVIKPNRVPNAFTKELTAKLSSVMNKATDDSMPKVESHISSGKKEQSALFGEMDNDDNDDLFSAKNSTSNLLFKKPTIFTDTDLDDQLFGESDSLFSRSNKPRTTNDSVKINGERDSNRDTAKESNPTHVEKPKKFVDEDDLFGNNDDLLFSGKTLGVSSRDSSGAVGWKDSREVKFSTPNEIRHNQVPNVDIFGSVSEIESNGSPKVENVSGPSADPDNSFNFFRHLSADISKDYGFIEPSDYSISKSGNFESPEVFEPRFTSTRNIPSDTSDYKTHWNTDPSTRTQNNSSLAEDNSNKSGMGHTEKSHFSREQSEANKKNSIFTDEDEDDDLFQTKKPSKLEKESNLFENLDNDDLFSNLTPRGKKNQSVFDETEENSSLFKNSSVPISEAREEEKPTSIDKVKQQDSVSMSSSRSSLFDDGGKSNLGSVFDTEKPLKSSDDLFGETDENIFNKDRISNFDENEVDDLFSTHTVTKSQVREKVNVSLFDDLEDTDDLFGDDLSKKLFQNNRDTVDLFGKSSSSVEPKEEDSEKHKGDNRTESEASQSKVDADFPISISKNDTDELFDNNFARPKKEMNPEFGNKKKSSAENNLKIGNTAGVDIFGELDDEDDDLFGNTRFKANSNNSSVKKIFSDKEGTKTLLDENFDDENIFKGMQQKVKSDDSFSSESKVKKESETRIGATEKLKQPDTVSVENDKGILSKTEMRIKDADGKALPSENKKNDDKESHFNGNDSSETRNIKSPPILENKDLFEAESNSLFSNNKSLHETRSLNDKIDDGIRPPPPNTLNIVKTSNLPSKHDNNYSETDGLVQSSQKPKVVGKLNIPANLKINPMSLLPGAIAKKNIDIENSEQSEKSNKTVKDLAFDENNSAPNLLKCLNKDRAKIQMRRRPQTRKARHEALRSSGIDFIANAAEISSTAARSKSVDDFEQGQILPQAIKSNSDTNVSDSVLVNSDSKTINNADSSSSVFHSIENSPEPLFSSPLVSNPLSPSTDEEDYFNVPELDINFEREDQSIFKSNLTDSKHRDKTDDTLLFDGAPVLSPMNPTNSIVPNKHHTTEKGGRQMKTENSTEKKVMNIDDVEVEDDDSLFKTSESHTLRSQQKKSEVKSRSSNIFDDLDDGDSFLFQKKSGNILGAREVPTKSLFDDNDEDDDLFSDKSIPSGSFTKILRDSPLKNNNKPDAAEKSKQPFIDPLGLMANPD